ncbi:MAG: cyanophycinase [Elusimicrobia bacterium]|nr:cyanophycinase [Elusimicrobiota bacterium]
MRALLAAALCALALPARAAGPRLVLVGGGARPAEALARFTEWSGGTGARILVVPWASSEPAEAASALADELLKTSPLSVTAAPSTMTARAELAALFEAASGVFFTGGDQVRLMEALSSAGLAERMRALSAAGTVFGGTSAGTAVMSPVMITGEGDFTRLDAAKVATAPGLGLLADTLVDQHFLRRQRQNRLFALLLGRTDLLGLGVDEDTALLVDGPDAEVVGPSVVMAVRASGMDSLAVEVLRPGRRYPLKSVAR